MKKESSFSNSDSSNFLNTLHFSLTEESKLHPIEWMGVAIWIGKNLAAGVVGAIGAQIWKRLTGEKDVETIHKEAMEVIVAPSSKYSSPRAFLSILPISFNEICTALAICLVVLPFSASLITSSSFSSLVNNNNIYSLR